MEPGDGLHEGVARLRACYADVLHWRMAVWNTGAKNGMWQGGRTVASNGYVLVRVGPEHHLADVRGYAYEHRVVAEGVIGRRLRRGEQVHHKNGNKQDNRPDNLEVLGSFAEHRVKHRTREYGRRRPGQENPTVGCACGCGTMFRVFDTSGRPRRYVSGHNTRHRGLKGGGAGA